MEKIEKRSSFKEIVENGLKILGIDPDGGVCIYRKYEVLVNLEKQMSAYKKSDTETFVEKTIKTAFKFRQEYHKEFFNYQKEKLIQTTAEENSFRRIVENGLKLIGIIPAEKGYTYRMYELLILREKAGSKNKKSVTQEFIEKYIKQFPGFRKIYNNAMDEYEEYLYDQKEKENSLNK